MVSKKDFILDSAQKLFIEQGFDQTSIAQLLEVTQIARGTLYYYFSSKEEIMDAIIERSVAQAFSKAELLASKKEGSILERLMGALLALNLHQEQGQEILAHLHQPQNALLHEKTNQILLERGPQILLPIIEDALAKGEMKTDFPLESLEMLLAYSLQVFGQAFQQLTKQEQEAKLQAFLYLLERIFQTQSGYFDQLLQLF
ncbi:TetR/AcrR family transcriptional regulator [Streptococcus cristatus]|uniref:TetR/AcrR family transcriptional regulator n=1 Tax=Streptococcus cristatus TaxID=45634 RepID=A0A5B0DCZ4_STRCR|nr:TetR/AcrR family transcriptional regulator [Streptococcus cristatus]KAA0964126.1 TetR/AcrR family transcriptional regulator [Streptococcus cristatus]